MFSSVLYSFFFKLGFIDNYKTRAMTKMISGKQTDPVIFLCIFNIFYDLRFPQEKLKEIRVKGEAT